MADKINKPSAMVSEEWAELCDKETNATIHMLVLQASFASKYPTTEEWTEYKRACDASDSARKESDKYRATVNPI